MGNCVLLKVEYVDMFFGGKCAFARNVAILGKLFILVEQLYIMVEKI